MRVGETTVTEEPGLAVVRVPLDLDQRAFALGDSKRKQEAA